MVWLPAAVGRRFKQRVSPSSGTWTCEDCHACTPFLETTTALASSSHDEGLGHFRQGHSCLGMRAVRCWFGDLPARRSFEMAGEPFGGGGDPQRERLLQEKLCQVFGHLAPVLQCASAQLVRGSNIEQGGFEVKLSQMLDRVFAKLHRLDEERYRRQVTWFAKKVDASLQDTGLRIVQIEGQPFDPGIAATGLNLAEFDDDESLVVDQMIEPIVMGQKGIVRNADVGAASTGEDGLQNG